MIGAARYNRFVEPYNDVVRRLEAGDLEGAASAFEKLEKTALPERQTKAVTGLWERLDELREGGSKPSSKLD